MDAAQSADEYGTVTAKYYDHTYAALRGSSGDAEFYRTLAQECGGPVLELGCGTGRVLGPIARDGLACTGLDASAGMLEVCRRTHPLANLRLVQSRMQCFDLRGDRFRLIFAAFRAVQHLYTVGDQLECLAAVRRHMAPGGRFAFDVFTPRLERVAVEDEAESEDARFQQDGMEVARYARVHRDRTAQLMDVWFRYECRRDGTALREEHVHIRMRYFFRFELEHLLARAGFTEVTFYGGFDRRPYDYASGETIVVAS